MVPLTERPAPELLTARLRLPLVTPEDAAGMLAGRRRVSWLRGYPSPADLDLATLVPGEPDEPDGWGPRHVVRRGDGATVGCAALVGPPEAGDDGVGEVEAVVRLVDDARGRGAGREALAGLLAEADRLGVRVRAAISPDDPAAMRFATRNGFTGLRGARDDGALVMVRPLPGTTAVASSPAARPTRRTGARPMTPRLVATDLDGTLLRSDRTVSPRTAATLERAHESGLPVVFVTGRPLRWAAEVFEHVGRHGLVIAANGALVWDVSTDGPRLERTIAADDVDHVTAAVRAEFPGAAFAVERLDGFMVEDHEAYRPQHELAPDVRRRPLAELVAAPVQKLLVRNPGHLADDYAPRVQELAGDRVEVTFSNGDDLLEVSAAGVTKASTLALLCEELGVQPGEVVALGDMPNDVAMLRWAGTSYAMADAHPLAVEAATHRALSNDDDGVAVVIEGLLGAQ